MELDSLQEVSKFDMLDEDIFPDYILETDTLAVGDGLNSNYIKKILIQGDICLGCYECFWNTNIEL